MGKGGRALARDDAWADPDATRDPALRPTLGRPRNAELGSRVMTWIPVSTHQRLIRIAAAESIRVGHQVSVSAVVKHLILLGLR
jgi:hypothetical protein